MLAPELQELRPGDFVKVRGTSNPQHSGGKAVVVAVHRSEGPPWRTVALDVRYSARGTAVRVDVAGHGELARWETPWAPAHTVEDEPTHEPVVPLAAHAAPGVPRGRVLVAAALALLAAGAGLWTWEHQRPEPNPVLVQRALQEGARGTGVANAPLATATPSTTTRAPYLATVVAWAAGNVPVVEGLEGANPTPLAGIAPVAQCRDAYLHDLFAFLPLGQQVDVTGAGWYRTDDGLDVNAELVRTGRAVPDPATAGTSATDVQNLAALQELAADAPHDCG